MLAAELLYQGGHVCHIAAYYELMRINRIIKVRDALAKQLGRYR